MQLHTITNSYTKPKKVNHLPTHAIKRRHAQTNADTNIHTRMDGDANAKSPNIANIVLHTMTHIQIQITYKYELT